ncbi:hypothetical protein E2562_013450 [Oryza meyeriana var. granulata]|uniref:Uncharacterized protein n=1 Tax=Oryza meyeriana var. granulata TaxID=110450 RepID=A0A6G1BWN5_9ORYZ|nr:hypothetical protein E2562_013450 [Oryza meyeriana var. granulata]
MPPPLKRAEVVEEAESSALARGAPYLVEPPPPPPEHEEVEEDAENSAQLVKKVEDGDVTLGEVEAVVAHVAGKALVVVEAATCMAGEAGDGEDGAAALGEVKATAAHAAAETMAMNRRRSGHGWSWY